MYIRQRNHDTFIKPKKKYGNYQGNVTLKGRKIKRDKTIHEEKSQLGRIEKKWLKKETDEKEEDDEEEEEEEEEEEDTGAS